MDSTFTISTPGKPPVKCHIDADMAQPRLLGIIPKLWDLTPSVVIELTKARVEFSNFVVPTFMHSITIREKDGNGKLTGQKRVEKVFAGGPQWERIGLTGESWWTTYRFQLESFVKAVKAKVGGEKYDGPIVTLEESEKVMEVIDAVYEKAGMPKRGT
jgi:predicted dehydrogenase